eukprot:XP_011684032.1 PREDICTED: putative ammonium transporter 1 [Strongylocentrotus purpuratus]
MDNSTEDTACTATDADHFFLIVMSCIIFLMQMGFAFLEAGSVRAKNTTNILLKNLLDVCKYRIPRFIYPIVVHWAWSSDGWLANGPSGIGYQDFAGSGVVHCVGGTAALVGAAILGPRIGRYDENGKSKVISGHTVPMVALGGFVLFFGFFAFNGGSQASISVEGDGTTVSLAIINTIISGACAALVAMIIRKIGFSGSYWSLLTTINGGLTGMVAICAGCDAVYPWGAAIIGAVAGATYMMWSALMVAVKVDDPLDAVAVHLGGGIWGVLAAPLFDMNDGVVFTFSATSWQSFGWNLLGVFVIVVWTSVLSLVLFGLMQACGVLRVTPEMELKGLDVPKHGEPAYPIESYGSGWESNQTNNGNGHQIGQRQEYTNAAFEGAVAINNPSYTDKENGENDLPL